MTIHDVIAVFTVGMLNRSTGSAYLEMGSTKVAVAVQGPRQADSNANFTARGALNITVHICPFAGMHCDKSKVRQPHIHGHRHMECFSE
jgi:ribonuclease PH